MPEKPEPPEIAANRRLWDRWTELHADSPFYDAAGVLAGASTLTPIERREVGDVAGLDLLHLQCHFGLDTLSWARLGARATGVDLSPKAIERARALAVEAGVAARFVCADVYALPAALGDAAAAAFDVVFTSWGVLWWLPDLPAWGEVVAACLKPGGRFHLVEFHPASACVDDDGSLARGYFRGDEADREVSPPSYAAPEAGPATGEVAFGWPHPLGQVVTALTSAGLRLDHLHEHDHSPIPCPPFTVEEAPGRHRMAGAAARLPHGFSLRATRPA